MLTCYQLKPQEQRFVKPKSEYEHFLSVKCVWICRQRNVGHFVQTAVYRQVSNIRHTLAGN